MFAGGGYAGPKLRNALASIGRWTLQIVKRSDIAIGCNRPVGTACLMAG
jgi:transposase